MTNFNRRTILSRGLAAATAAAMLPKLASSAATSPDAAPASRKNRIHQSVSRWCYKQIPLDDLCVAAAAMGLKGIDLLQPEEYDVPTRHGLICTMGYAGAGDIGKALNRLENHDAIEAGLRKNLPLAAKAGVPNVITFSGLRAGMSDEEGARNTVIGLRRLKTMVADHGVTLNMELLNSKRDHHDYMCDHTAWGVKVLEQVDSPHIKFALRHLPHADYGRRFDLNDSGQYQVVGSLPYRRRPRQA